MNILIRILGTLMILLAFVCAVLCFVYIIQIELYEIFEVDVLFKLKRKLERICYGEKRSTKVVGKLFRGRTSSSRKNRKVLRSIKSRLRERQYLSKAISQQKKNVAKEVGRGGQAI